VAADILRHGHQPDTAAVAAVATVSAVRHIATTTTTAAAAIASAGQGRRQRFPVLAARRWPNVRLAGHIPLEHRRHTVAGRFPELSARRVRSRRQ